MTLVLLMVWSGDHSAIAQSVAQMAASDPAPSIASVDDIRNARDALATASGTAADPATPAAEDSLRGAPAPQAIMKTFSATAYSLKGATASGINVRRGIIAADPRVLPIGSVVRILAGKYSGIYTVMDTGGSLKGRRIDIYMPSQAEALRFGSRQVKVEVLRHGWNPEPQAVEAK
jgi:3D (Asp-Asp-Asp) domain-containing protein